MSRGQAGIIGAMGTNTPSYWGHGEQQPWMAASMASLAGVLLSVLAVWIAAMPPPTHAVVIELWTCLLGPAREPVTHIVTVGVDGRMSWDGQPVSAAALDARMRTIGAGDRLVQAEVLIEPHPQAGYGAVIAVLASAQRNGVVGTGLVGRDGTVSQLPCATCGSRQ